MKEVYPNWITGEGIFATLQNYDVPWKDKNLALPLDLDYYGNYSGDKIISPLLHSYAELSVPLTDMAQERIAQALLAVYLENWSKLYATLHFEYNPINNYDMTETMSNTTTYQHGKVITHSDLGTITTSGQSTRTPELTHTMTPNVSDTVTHTIAGFNSSTYVDSTKDASVRTGTETSKDTGTDTTSANTNQTVNKTLTDKDSGKDINGYVHRLTRNGNIGVTTSQQMIQSERDLWLWNYFRGTVYPDIDRILTLPIY